MAKNGNLELHLFLYYFPLSPVSQVKKEDKSWLGDGNKIEIGEQLVEVKFPKDKEFTLEVIGFRSGEALRQADTESWLEELTKIHRWEFKCFKKIRGQKGNYSRTMEVVFKKHIHRQAALPMILNVGTTQSSHSESPSPRRMT